MIVWRLQGPDGQGPYQSSIIPHHALDRNGGDNQPGPWDDFDHYKITGRLNNPRWVFGFPCLAAAYRWFGRRRLARLTRYNFFVTALEVPDSCVIISESKSQCIFDRSAHEKTP